MQNGKIEAQAPNPGFVHFVEFRLGDGFIDHGNAAAWHAGGDQLQGAGRWKLQYSTNTHSALCGYAKQQAHEIGGSLGPLQGCGQVIDPCEVQVADERLETL